MLLAVVSVDVVFIFILWINVCQFAAVGLVPVARSTNDPDVLLVATVIPLSAVAESESPDFAFVIVIRTPAIFPPLASSAKFGKSGVS